MNNDVGVEGSIPTLNKVWFYKARIDRFHRIMWDILMIDYEMKLLRRAFPSQYIFGYYKKRYLNVFPTAITVSGVY